MKERMRQTKKVRKFTFERFFFFFNNHWIVCHVSVILFKMGDNWGVLNGGKLLYTWRVP